MAFVDSGPVEATDRFEATPRDRWPHLMRAKRTFLATKLSYDCRCLVDFVSEAESVWDQLGFSSTEDMIRNGYELDPVEVDLAVAWLKHNEQEVAVSLKQVQDIASKVEEAKANPARGEKGGAPKGNKNASKNEHNIGNSKVVLPGGTNNKRTLARLARDGHEELLDAIETGELSVNAAAIRVGYRKRKTPAELALANFRKCEDRLEPLKAIVSELEPHERAVVAQWLAGG